MRQAVIMAGGAGTRLWPLSRKQRPKQLMRLFGGQSLLQIARGRLTNLFAPENTWIITSADYLDLVARELPDLPPQNLIGEPCGRDTANAVGLAAHLMSLRSSESTMAVFTADHLITPQDRFEAAIKRGLEAAERHPQALVTFGITPQRPDTGYGYVHLGDEVGSGVRRVKAFKEKPTREVAEQYVSAGEYAWNSGMFAWRTEAILAELARCLPDNAERLGRLAREWTRLSPEGLRTQFEALPRISIDFGVMEKAREVLSVEMTCDWLDLGSWPAVAQTHEADNADNVAVAERAMFLDSARNIVISEAPEHLVVTLGVKDIVVVHSEDATLICHRDEVQRIKELVEPRQERFGGRYE